MWSKASTKERKDLLITEVSKMEEECYKVRAMCLHQQGRWTTWEAINRNITLADMWKMPQARLSFLIGAMYDVLLGPQILHLWYGSENCHLCSSQNPSLSWFKAAQIEARGKQIPFSNIPAADPLRQARGRGPNLTAAAAA